MFDDADSFEVGDDEEEHAAEDSAYGNNYEG